MRAKIEKKDRYVAFVLKEEGYSIRQAAEKLGRSHSCIVNIIQRYKETRSINDRHRTGRNKISNDRDVRSLVILMKENRQEPSRDLSMKWTLSNGLKASPKTVRRVLHSLNYLWRAAAKKPRLHKKQNLPGKSGANYIKIGQQISGAVWSLLMK
ncbi:uncharacterized protein LOC136081400 [Hydra vulgaris]|uniref:Uncharacterized protein LOC136081400 n=1 Tax=Hydra vulgaris TaxID=6087 RepID=A0ABM4BZU6_HYDVU